MSLRDIEVALPAHEWEGRLTPFSHATPELIAEYALSARSVEKFILPAAAAASLLPALANEYLVVRAGSRGIATYETLYFDTAALELYHEHRRGFRIRHKVRIRSYPDRCLTRLEVKTRQSDVLTTKAVRGRAYGEMGLRAADRRFAEELTGLDGFLAARAFTQFNRLTLIGIAAGDRVTIDLDLVIGTESRRQAMPGVAIVEVKQPPAHERRDTPALHELKAQGWRRCSISKYAAAIALLHPGIAHNRLLPGLRALQRAAA